MDETLRASAKAVAAMATPGKETGTTDAPDTPGGRCDHAGARPTLRLFGGPLLVGRDGEVAWSRQRRCQLLCYLALAARSVDRDRLAFLFWPDEPNDVARRHLRKMLYDLKGLPGLAGLPLRIDPIAVEWRVDTDVQLFEAAVRAGRWADAIALGALPLADAMDGSSPEFDDWLQRERTRLRSVWRRALLCWLAATADGADRDADAGPGAWVEMALLQDPVDEELAVARIRWLLRRGAVPAARRAHDTLARSLACGLGATPMLGWKALVEGAGTAPAAMAAAAALAPAPAPAMMLPATRFFGRDDELRELARLLIEGRRRLVTLCGPPGVGKTRLALEFAARWPGPVRPRTVALETLDANPPGPLAEALGGELASRIGAAFGFDLHAAGDPVAGLVAALGREETLVLLDNFEHRLGDLPLLGRLLGQTRCTLLVTSRCRLGLAAEVCFDLGGLRSAEADAGAAGALFIDRAGLRLPLDAAARPLVARICTLAAGQPLALELAARQSRHLSLPEIARRLADDIGALDIDAADLPPRQRSLAAAFEGSWRLLAPARQRVLAQLSVLRGGFDRALAEAVAGAEAAPARRAVEAALADLVAASLLSHDALDGGHRWHPFVREFAAERLASNPGDARAAQRGLGLHIVESLERWRLAEAHPDPAALAWVGARFDHLVAAWRWALAERRSDCWEVLAEAIAMHCEIHARYDEGARLLAEAGVQAEPRGDADAGDAARIAARVRVLRSRLQHWLEGLAARATALEALEVFARHDDVAGRIAALRVLGLVAWRRGEGEAAVRHFMAALTMGERSGHGALRAILLDGLGLAYTHLGLAGDALRCFGEALALNRERGNPYQAVQNLINLALAHGDGAAHEALALAQRAVDLALQVGYEHYVPHALCALAVAQLGSGDAAAALAHACEAGALARRSGDAYVEAWALRLSAQARLRRGLVHEAREDLRRGLQLAADSDDVPQLRQHLATAAQLAAAIGDARWAARLQGAACAEPPTPPGEGVALDGTPAPASAPTHERAALVQAVLGWLAPGHSPTPHV